MQGPGRADLVNAGSGESGFSECMGRGRADLVRECGYSECRVRGEQTRTLRKNASVS
ncbi:unnamed protein product, partial [Staurois parvus]